MAIQDTYKDYMDQGHPGAIADQRIRDLFSRTCEDEGITPFGVAVVKGTTDRTCTTDLTGAEEILGITVLDRGARVNFASNEEGFAQYDSARLAAKGGVWVVAGVDVEGEEPAYVTLANPGVFTNVATDNLRVGKFESTAEAGGLVILRIDL